MKTRFQKTLRCMIAAKKTAWAFLIGSLKLCLLFLFAALICLFLTDERGDLQYFRLSYIFRDLSQLSLLLGALVPPCLEDLLPSD